MRGGRATSRPKGQGDIQSFGELFGEDAAEAETLFDAEAFDADRMPVEHTPGLGPVLTAGAVGPKVDGTAAVAHIAVVSPAAFASAAKIEASSKAVTARFKARGQKVSLDQAPGAPFAASNVHDDYALAGTDEQRWNATKWGLFDAATSALICERGGYGVMRFLDRMYAFVNYDPSQPWKKPKRIIGYSDVTALLLASYSLMGWACLHGPMLVDSGKGDPTLDSLIDALTKDPKDLYPGNLVAGDLDVATKAPVADQRIRGVLVGGNLSLVEPMYASPYLPSLKGAILFLEETHEPEYRIDRMLEGLALRGILDDIQAVVLGNFTDLSPAKTADLISGAWSLPPAGTGGGGRRPLPVVYGLKSGHMTPNLALWIGLEHELVIKGKGTKADLYLRPPP